MQKPQHIELKHWQEWTIDSAVDPSLTADNVISLSDYEPLDRLLYGLSSKERRNDGRLRDKWLRRYRNTEAGGWWCSGVNVLKGVDAEWGQFKPDTPYSYCEKPQGFDRAVFSGKFKNLKYEAPPKVATEITAFKLNFVVSWNIIKKQDEKAKEAWIQRFWDSAQATKPHQEIEISERVHPIQGRRNWTDGGNPTGHGNYLGSRQGSRLSGRKDQKESSQSISIKEFQAACERREYGEIDRLLQRAIRNSSRLCSPQSEYFDFRGIEGFIWRIDVGFWQWFIDTPSIPLVITEGSKKGGSIITVGKIAISLPGVFNGYRSVKDDWGNKIEESQLIPQLQAFAQKDREIIFCFDSDTKIKTVKNVRKAIANTGRLFAREGCKVSVMQWKFPEKGIDDLIAARGKEQFDILFENRIDLDKFRLDSYLSLKYYKPQVVNQRYLDIDLPDANLVGLKSPKNTGKTQWLTEIVEKAQQEGRMVLVLTHRIQLAKALCERFGIDHIEEVYNSQTKGVFGYGMCVDSLHPNSQAHFNSEDWENAYIIIDECEQVFWHLLDSNTCQNNRVAIIKNFRKLIRTAIGTGGKIFLADADLSAIAIEYVMSCVNKVGEVAEAERIREDWEVIGADDDISIPYAHAPKLHIVENIYQFQQQKTLHIYDGGDPHKLVAALLKEIQEGKKVLIHTSGQKAKSKYGSTNLEVYLRRKFPDRRIIRIDSATVADPEHPAMGCMQHLDTVLSNYDIAIASPVIETGVSIDIKTHFDSVWCIAYGVQTVDSVCQTVERLRDNVPRHVWVKAHAKNMRIGNGGTIPYYLLKSQQQITKHNIDLLHKAGVCQEGYTTGFSTESLETWSKRACVVNAGKNNYRQEIIAKLLGEGYRIGDDREGNSELEVSVKDEITATRDVRYREEREAIAAAKTLTDAELEALDNKKAKTTQERRAERKGKLTKRYGLQVTPEVVEKDDRGWFNQLQLHYYLTIGRSLLPKREEKTLDKLKPDEGNEVFGIDVNKRLLSCKIRALELLNIKQFLDPDRTFSSRNLADWMEQMIQMRHQIKAILGVSINPEKDSAIAIAQRLLAKLGLKLRSLGWTGGRADKHRSYGGCNSSSDAREVVFSSWQTS